MRKEGEGEVEGEGREEEGKACGRVATSPPHPLQAGEMAGRGDAKRNNGRLKGRAGPAPFISWQHLYFGVRRPGRKEGEGEGGREAEGADKP